MNARNLHYIRPHNLKRAIRIADDKLLSKRILNHADIPTPKLIAKISSRTSLEHFDWGILPNSFALKPNRGLGGEGIIVVYGRKKGQKDVWVKSSGSVVTLDDLKNHIQNILDGAFSLSGVPDTAFFEERITLAKEFRPYAYRGIPDIRVIVYNGVPVMAMLRLPTKESHGKANLQQGGVGVGIDLSTGTTTTAVQGKSKVIEYIPGTRLLISGIKIPYWKKILQLAVEAQRASKLGFLGADIAIDRTYGPVFLELNARPGLSIQVANLSGLRRRLERVSGLKIKTIARGIAVGENLFGGEIEEELEVTSGKKVIGSIEQVKLISEDETEIEVEAKIDTGAYSTSIDIELAKQLGFEKTLTAFDKIDLSMYDLQSANEKDLKKELFEKHSSNVPHLKDVAIVFTASGATIRPIVHIQFVMDKTTIDAKVNIIDRSELKYPMIIGKRNLHKFLVDVSK